MKVNEKNLLPTPLFFLILGIFVSGEHLIAQNEIIIESNESFAIGEKIKIKSDILDEVRALNIYLPHDYSKDSVKKYPVIYLLDGAVDEDFIHIAGLVQFCSFSWVNMMPESIVVGIPNTNRNRDFTFPSRNKKDTKDMTESGESETFMRFIEEELQPLIENKYNTAPVKTLVGQSMGGLLASEILIKKPELFDNYIIVSPSLWWDKESLMRLDPKPHHTKKSIYIAVGKEGSQMERLALELYTRLEKSEGENSDVYFDFLKKLTHATALHLAVYNAFERIFEE